MATEEFNTNNQNNFKLLYYKISGINNNIALINNDLTDINKNRNYQMFKLIKLSILKKILYH